MKGSNSIQSKMLPVTLLLAASVYGQITTPVQTAVAPINYVTSGALPPNATDYLRAVGGHVQTSGHERITLIGTVTDHHGTATAQLVWEAPGNVRLDRQSTTTPLIFVPATGVQNSASLVQSDLDILESLASDCQEAFLYSFAQKTGHRLLGTGFRTDGGKTANYLGPYYDIYEIIGPVQSAGNAVRQKWYFFDSTTKLLTKTRYLLKRSGNDLPVETQYSNWTKQNGESFPGKIVRTENNTPVFTLTVSRGTLGPSVSDGLFPAH